MRTALHFVILLLAMHWVLLHRLLLLVTAMALSCCYLCIRLVLFFFLALVRRGGHVLLQPAQ